MLTTYTREMQTKLGLHLGQVTVRAGEAAWEIAVKATRPWPETAIRVWREKILAAVPGLMAVDIRVECVLADVAQLVDGYWDCWVNVTIPDTAPVLRTYLAGAGRRPEGNRVILSLEAVQAALLTRRQCLQDLRKTAFQVFGLEVNMEIEEIPAPDPDEYQQVREEEEKRLWVVANGANRPEKEKAGDGPVLGRLIGDTPLTRIADLNEEERSITIRGRVFSLETREMKTGRCLVTFNLDDGTGAVTVKVFVDKKDQLIGAGRLKDGVGVMVRGPLQLDRYLQELVVQAKDINLVPVTFRSDDAPEKRVELHAHTKMSTLDAVVTAKDLVARAAAWGHPAVAITDHGVAQAFPEAYEAGQKHGIKVIYGVEGYLVDKPPVSGEKLISYHVILLVRNQTGLHNLYRLITSSHLEYFYRRPRILRQELVKYREGLLVGSACEAGEIYRAVLHNTPPERLREMAAFYDYLEIQPNGNNLFLCRRGQVASEEALYELNRRIVRLGEELGKPVVATGDVHFLDPADEVYRRILLVGKGFEDADNPSPLYLRTTDEMLAEFAYLGPVTAKAVVIENPAALAAGIEPVKPIPDEFYPPVIEGAADQVREMAETSACCLYGPDLPELVRQRLDKELHSIITNGFAVLYLIAHKLVKKSNDDGYLVGSRGSVGSSLVATLTGITEVNPLPPHYRCPGCCFSEFITDGSVGAGVDLPDRVCPRCGIALVKDGHDIPFETFLGFEGDKVPDIDLNFSGEYQPRAHKYIEEIFGKDRVFRAGTISTIAARTAYGFAKNYVDGKNIQARKAEIDRLVAGCTGVKRTTGQHPGGLMVVPREVDIHDFTPLQYPADDTSSGTITTHFDYHAISSRLVKLDILGHDDPTVIKMLEDLTGVSAQTVPLDDPATMSLFSSPAALGVNPKHIRANTGTYGIPEFGTRFVRQMLEDTQPKTFSELVRISGFSHGTDVWLNNARDLIKSDTCRVNEAISTRDDIMLYLLYRELPPKKAFAIMEGVRKGKGVKPEDQELMREKGVPAWYIDSCNKIKYMFPKAHAVAYVTMAFRIAWYKVHYPEAFYASFFTVRADEFDAEMICRGMNHVRLLVEELDQKGNDLTAKERNWLTILEVALEMYAREINMQRVSLQKSHATRFLIEPAGLLPSLGSLPGVGAGAAQNIMQAREERPFSSIEDLRVRARVSKTVIESLQNHGCLAGMGETDQLSLF